MCRTQGRVLWTALGEWMLDISFLFFLQTAWVWAEGCCLGVVKERDFALWGCFNHFLVIWELFPSVLDNLGFMLSWQKDSSDYSLSLQTRTLFTSTAYLNFMHMTCGIWLKNCNSEKSYVIQWYFLAYTPKLIVISIKGYMCIYYHHHT